MIYEVFSLVQSASPISAIIDLEEVAKCVECMVENDEDTSQLKVWWHSHVNMPARWSCVDHAMADSFHTDYMIGILGNQKHEFTCRVDIYEPFRMTISDLPLCCPEWDQIDREVEEEIRRNVRGV